MGLEINNRPGYYFYLRLFMLTMHAFFSFIIPAFSRSLSPGGGSSPPPHDEVVQSKY